MAKGEKHKLQQKKLELEEELNNLHRDLDDSLDKVRTEVSSQLDPKRLIRNHPLISVGTAAMVGFLLGHKRSHSSNKKSKGDSITDTIVTGLKGIAARKVIAMAVNFVEKRMDEKGKS